MYSRLSVLLLFMALFTVLIIPLPGFCQDESGSTLDYLVSFVPPVTVDRGEESSDCAGVVISPERIALSSACAASARRLRQEGAITVLNHQGNSIGQMPAIGDQPFAALQTLLEPEWLVPFVSELEQNDDFPVFADTYSLAEDELAAESYQLLNPYTAGEEVLHSPVQLHKLSAGKGMFSVSGLSSVQLEQYPPGSPVVNEQGEVLCLLGDEGDCESVTLKALAGDDDGSCHIPYFECGNVTWGRCTHKAGIGKCMNENSNETCNVTVVPDMFVSRDGSLHCRNSVGCGTIGCPVNCCPDENHCNCECTALWGFCEELYSKTNTIPDKCIDQHGGKGGIDARCHITPAPATTTHIKPDDFRHSSEFFGVVIGVPAGLLTIGTVAIVVMVGIACKYRPRMHYQTIQ